MMKIFLMKDWMHPVGNASNEWYDIVYSNGVKFSTLDRVNDPDPNCQSKYHMGLVFLRVFKLKFLVAGGLTIAD